MPGDHSAESIRDKVQEIVNKYKNFDKAKICGKF
jgi:hypothetical protein